MLETSDAAWANARDGEAVEWNRRLKLGTVEEAAKPMVEQMANQAGHIVMLTDRRIQQGAEVPVSFLCHRGFKLKRKAASTLSAEIQSMLQGSGQALWVRGFAS